jgi:hypothetical protein
MCLVVEICALFVLNTNLSQRHFWEAKTCFAPMSKFPWGRPTVPPPLVTVSEMIMIDNISN